MKITVFSGSPKREDSISLQYLKYIVKHNPEHVFSIFHIGSDINLIKNGKDEFNLIIESVKNSDAVLWVFPVYHYLVPAQLKEFIELIFDTKSSDYFRGKYSSSIITSIHFYDTLAENYIHAVSEDLGMKYIPGFLAKMDDLKNSDGQSALLAYSKNLLSSINNSYIVTKVYNSNMKTIKPYIPVSFEKNSKNSDFKITLITDCSPNSENLKNMITTFISCCTNKVTVINLDEVETKGGCTGCCRCGYENKCIYNDEMDTLLNNFILKSDAIVIASEIKSRYLGWQIKRLFDRTFTFGHTPIFENIKFLYLISGEFSNSHLLKYEIEARSSIGKYSVVDIVTDEFLSSEELDLHLKQAGNSLIESIKNNKQPLKNFHYLAGQKIFRDFVYLMKFVFRADHLYYKKHNLYDFPQKKFKIRFINRFLLILLKIKPFRNEFEKRIKPSMVSELKKIAQ